MSDQSRFFPICIAAILLIHAGYIFIVQVWIQHPKKHIERARQKHLYFFSGTGTRRDDFDWPKVHFLNMHITYFPLAREVTVECR